MKSINTEIWGTPGFYGWSAWIGRQEVRAQIYYSTRWSAQRGLSRFLARQGK